RLVRLIALQDARLEPHPDQPEHPWVGYPDADRKNGPAARSFAADAHDCIMVRIQTVLPYTSLRHEDAPIGKLPSDHQQRHRPDAEAVQRAPSQSIIAPRTQASSAAKHKRR